MIRRSTRWALLAFVVLAAVAYGVGRHKHTKEANITPPPTTPPLVTFSSDDVVGLELKSPDQSIVLQRDGDQWKVLQPTPQGNEQPDQERISTAIFGLTTLETVNTIPAGTDLDSLGLLSPAYTITVYLKNGKQWQIAIGKETPIGSGYYAKANGGLWVVSHYAVDALTELLTKPPLVTPIPTSTPTATPTPSP